MKDCKKKTPKINSWIFLFLICIATCFMGVGFARIDISLDITGNATTDPQDGLFITEVNYVSNVGADLNNSQILNSYQTNLNSNIVLSQTDANSKITYEIKVYNSTDSDYEFEEALYMLGVDTYDNENIIFELEGLSNGEIIKSKETISFNIIFYYKNNTLSTNNQLKSIINFKFEKYVPLISAGTLNTTSSSGVFGSTIDKNSIERIYFVNHENVPAEASNVWDASEEGNYAIRGWSIDEDQNGLLEVYLGSEHGRISLPAVCTSMISYYNNLKSIDFDNIDTSKVTNMYQMFYYNNSLSELNLSNFDTSNVTNMGYMFFYCAKIKEFDLSSFNTSSVTNMSYMFFGSKPELIKFDNAIFSHVSSSYGVFPNISESLTIVVKDSVEKNWVISKSTLGANTQILTVEEYENGT